MPHTSTQSKNKYNNKTYNKIAFMVKKTDDKKDRYKEAADYMKMSLSAFIIEAIEEKIKKENITFSDNTESPEQTRF